QVRRLIDLGPGFSFQALGGEPRVRLLSETLRRLKEYEIDLIICTKGLVGTCRKILQDCGLLPFFRTVYGNIGDCYGCSQEFDVMSSVEKWFPPRDVAAL
ncbi:tsuA, partial [Symbiodinium microadriaticum]